MVKGCKGCGKFSLFEILLCEVDYIVVWVNGELVECKCMQVEIYVEFEEKCCVFMNEFGGDLEFDILLFLVFNCFFVCQVKFVCMCVDVCDMMCVVGDDFDIEDSDGLMIFVVDSIKVLVNILFVDGDLSLKQVFEFVSVVC